MDEIKISVEDKVILGILQIPKNAKAIVLFAHGSGSSRLSPRNQLVAKSLNEKGIATLLMDLLTGEEEAIDDRTGELRFDIGFLAKRLTAVKNWIKNNEETKDLKIGYFGASTGAAAALSAAAGDKNIFAVISRGGRPDLALKLANVTAPTLLIIGGTDTEVIELNKQAYEKLKCEKEMKIIPGATHLFEESGKLEKVAELATKWFLQHSK